MAIGASISDDAALERGVAIVTQSGNIGCNVTMQARGLPIAYLTALYGLDRLAVLASGAGASPSVTLSH